MRLKICLIQKKTVFLHLDIGWCRGASDLDLALPEEEVFDSKKLCIKSCSEVSYLLNENTIIKAVFDDDNYDDGESGDTYYYNGDCLE